MMLDEYAQWAATIAKPGASRNERLTFLVLALIGEAGEACHNMMNLIRDGKLDEPPARSRRRI